MHPPQLRREGEALADAHDRPEEKNSMTLEGERFPRLVASMNMTGRILQHRPLISSLEGSRPCRSALDFLGLLCVFPLTH